MNSLLATTVDYAQAKEAILLAFSVGEVPYLMGSPGIGKTQLMQAIADEFNMELIVLTLSDREPSDLLGMPYYYFVNGDETTLRRSAYAPMQLVPLAGDPIPENRNGTILFLDELPQADIAVQKVGYRIILEHKLGDYDIHPNCYLAAAGNLISDNTHANELGTALQSRIAPHLHLVVNPVQWLQWAYKNNIHHTVTSFIEYMPNKLHDFDPDHSDHTFACPRTWEKASKFVHKIEAKNSGKALDLAKHRAVFAGTIGTGMAAEYLAFLDIFRELPTYNQMMMSPETVDLPSSPNLIFALLGVITDQITATNAQACFTVLDRFGPEFQICALRSITHKHPGILRSPEFAQWQVKNAELFAA